MSHNDELFKSFLSIFLAGRSKSIARYETNGLIVSTIKCGDKKEFETAISHNSYNNGEWVIVEEYETEEKAVKGHDHWVLAMTEEHLPKQLVDVSTSYIATLIDEKFGDDWRDL